MIIQAMPSIASSSRRYVLWKAYLTAPLQASAVAPTSNENVAEFDLARPMFTLCRPLCGLQRLFLTQLVVRMILQMQQTSASQRYRLTSRLRLLSTGSLFIFCELEPCRDWHEYLQGWPVCTLDMFRPPSQSHWLSFKVLGSACFWEACWTRWDHH